jgi:molecular chaperone DnaJ
MSQAALGTELEVPTLEESRKIVVGAGTQSGHVVRIKGAGVPHCRARGRGDLFVHIIVDTPTSLTPVQEELLRQLAGERGENLVEGITDQDGVFSRIRSAFG